MKTVREEITLRDTATGEVVVSATLTAARVKALIRAYKLAGIEVAA